MAAIQAIAYIEGLRLGCNAWQVYETWETEKEHCAVLAQWNSGFEVQTIIEVPIDGGPVRWIPCRIFRGDRGANFRGECVWFNPDEVERDAMVEHNLQGPECRRWADGCHPCATSPLAEAGLAAGRSPDPD